MDAPALIRILEYAREDLSHLEGDEGDIMLHFLADELLNSRLVTMEQYARIIRDSKRHYLQSQEEVSTLLRQKASLEYPHLTSLTKLTNYGAALMVSGVPTPEEFREEMKKRPYIWEHILPEVMEQTGWDQERVLQTAYDRAQKSVSMYQQRTPNLPGAVSRVVELYHEGKAGGGWYERAHEALVATFGADADLMAAFIAATSPGSPPSVNLQKALEAYQRYKEGKPFEGIGSRFGDHTIVKNLERAAKGEPLSGLKVWNFCRALQGDPNAVPVDMWMARAFLGRDQVQSDGEYLFVEQLIREVAHRLQKSAGSVTLKDVQRAAQEGLFQSYPDVQARIWYGINPAPQAYTEMLYRRLEQHRDQSPEFWEPYLQRATPYRMSSQDPQLYVIEATKDSGIPYPITEPMPQSEAQNMLTAKREQWEQQGYLNLNVVPAKDPIRSQSRKYQNIIRGPKRHYSQSQGEVSTRLHREASLEYPHLTSLTKLTNYGAALMVSGVPTPEEFREELQKRPYIWKQILPEVMEQTGWDRERVLQTAYDRSKQSVSMYKQQAPNLSGAVKRAVNLYREGKDGEGWYKKAHEALVATFGDDADLVAAFIAATSPGSTPSVNLREALEAYQRYKEGKSFKGIGSRFGDHTIVKNLKRATKGEPLSGLHVWNFCRALQGDPDAVPVDRWMARVFLGKDKVQSDGEYLFVEQLIREVAHQVQKGDRSQNYPDVQARIWHGVNPNPQSYTEILYQTLEENMEQSPKFWKPYLKRATPYRVSSQGPQLYPRRKFQSGSPTVIDRETWEEAREAGHSNPGLVLIYGGRRYPIDSGQSDDIDVFEEGNLLYILSVNRSIGYAGLQVLDPESGKDVANVFLQNKRDIEEVLGKEWEGLSPEEMLKALMPYTE
jgi:hypothetical protein